MKPKVPNVNFESGKPLIDQVSTRNLNLLRDFTIGEVVGGRLEPIPGQRARIIIDKKVESEIRSVVVSGGSADVTAGANVPLATLDSDVDITDSAGAVLVSVASNAITFLKVGTYIVTYHCNCELDLSGATTHIGDPVTIETEIYIGGSTFTGVSIGSFGSMQVANFGGFLKVEGGGALEVSTDLSGLVALSDPFETDSFATCPITAESTPEFTYSDEFVTGGTIVTDLTYTCADALTDSVLVDGVLTSTVADLTILDATTNSTTIEEYDATGEAHGVTSGTMMIKVIRDADDAGNIKILSGGIKYSPYITVYGVRTSSVGTTLVNNTSVSIFQL